ncbi:putative ATPase (AAA+ superfamily) [Actinobacteria bacterium IMCC26207]|nr:putative ATPase (AAA+ superfamily) [Actinobacteria bacterium IMCC26207]
MSMTNKERISKSLDLLRDALGPRCAEIWAGKYGEDWLNTVNGKLRTPDANPAMTDVAFLFKGLKVTWDEAFRDEFAAATRALVFELGEVRNTWAHQGTFSTDDTLRALDSMERVLEAFGNREERAQILTLRRDLMRQVFEEEARSERRKTASKPTEGLPQAGLTPWREIITPHADVASGRFEQSEFAADLQQVAFPSAGDAVDEVYSDPKAFFARTFLTAGLRNLLVGASRRLSGDGGDPVIELQTNFGGGKTHSMIALYHLASGLSPSELMGVGEALNEEEIELPASINRAVLVGQWISPSAPVLVEDGVLLHTLWGHLAYQLGGRKGYELVRTDDENGTNPGVALKKLFKKFGPAVVLIDEWVAYARQLRDEPKDRLAGGDFDTQFTFAQALTEAAASVPNVVVLVSIPSSDIEVGGDRGRVALEKLKNVVTRTAAQWQPASPDESFEIVRRRLFDPIPPEKAKVRDGVIYAYCEMYRNQPNQFPAGVSEAEYERRMKMSYPIHPELFDRLFEDWSALDKFQRTRGVLRLMAIAISELWNRGDQSLLITPGTLPMDSAALVSEMRKYLEEGWDPVIKSDVDGENALPLKIDRENPHFGRYSATRRAARTVYMASAPRQDGSVGVDIKSVVLGCVQPGEPPAQFGDALKRLSDQATHLYVDGAQFWFSLQPNVTRVAADRAASNFSDRDADDEVKRRIGLQGDRGGFVAMQVFAEGPGDVPDDEDGTRLVILSPNVTHAPNDANSSGVELAGRILAQRDGGPRLNRNLLVFVAASPARLPELHAATRSYLAWKSVCADHQLLNLTPHQQSQAESKVTASSAQVDSLIAETFTTVLTPSQEPGTAEVKWHSTKSSTGPSIAAGVAKKLATEEKLITSYGGIRVRMDIDRNSLWSPEHDLAIRKLWETYTRFLHMPRLATFDVLGIAISDGVANTHWETETFGYAAAHNGDKWVGLKTGEHVMVERTGLVIHPEHVPSKEDPTAPINGGGEQGGGDNPDNPAVTPPAPGKPGDGTSGGGEMPPASSTGFYSRFELSTVRGIRELGEIFDNVVGHLGPDVELVLEVRATKPDGFSEAVQRTVSENAANLGATGTEFE